MTSLDPTPVPGDAEFRAAIRDIQDYPKPGIVFKDITPLLNQVELFTAAIDRLADAVRPLRPTHFAAIESRGFIFAGGLCERLEAGFIPVRKPGKLPWKFYEEAYQLEYGQDKLQIHVDAAGPGDRVVLVDDLLATGGTAAAAVNLVRRTGAELVASCFVIELGSLNGRNKLHGFPTHSLICY
jgi:adenine phosphoribosyltransferase